MRASLWITFAITASAISAFAAVGCSSDDTAQPTTPAAVDAGATDAVAATDTSSGPIQDSGPATCDVDADITKLPVPDAAVGDSGISITDCLGCITDNCSSQLSTCQDDCDCRSAVVGFYDCIGTGGSIISCGSSLATGAGAASGGTALATCAYSAGCTAKCGVTLPGGDAGPDGGALDAAADADAN